MDTSPEPIQCTPCVIAFIMGLAIHITATVINTPADLPPTNQQAPFPLATETGSASKWR